MTVFNDYRKLAAIFLIGSIALSGCGISRTLPTPTATQPSPDAIFTAAAHTAEARRALTATAQPTNTPVPPTPTQSPPTATATLVFTTTLVSRGTVPAPGTAVTSAPTSSGPVSTSGDNAVFVEDRTIPDGTDFTPGASFEKTWRLMNSGSTTWSTSYSLVYISGDPLGAPASVPISLEVAPNANVDISVKMVAPNSPGNYKSYWRMRNPAGQFFGQSIYVDIDVLGEGQTPSSTQSSSQPTATSQPGGSTVSGVSISIESPTVTAECPHDYNVTASFTLLEPSEVTYEFEAGSDTAGFDFSMPEPVTADFSTGTHVLTFSFNITDTGSGWVQLHISQPEDVESARANFSLTCED